MAVLYSSTRHGPTLAEATLTRGDLYPGFLSIFQRATRPRECEVTDSLGDLLARLADASVHRAIAAEHSEPSFSEIEAYYDSRPELSAFTLSAEIRRMDYCVHAKAGDACITDPTRIQQLYAEGGGASAASCCGQCELIWRMANQSLVPYLLQPLLTRWMDPASGSTVCASACRFELDLPRQTLRCECTLLISCTSEHGERVRGCGELRRHHLRVAAGPVLYADR